MTPKFLCPPPTAPTPDPADYKFSPTLLATLQLPWPPPP